MTSQPGQHRPQRIVVGVDGSAGSRAALRWAADEAELHDAELEAVMARTPQLPMVLFGPGSLGPKVEAACRFVEVTGDMAAIGALEDAPAILQGKAGTIITPAGDYEGPHDLGPRPPPAISVRVGDTAR